jgi:hypothetical protein
MNGELATRIGDILRGGNNPGGVFLGSLEIRLDRHGHRHRLVNPIASRTITVSLRDIATRLYDRMPDDLMTILTPVKSSITPNHNTLHNHHRPNLLALPVSMSVHHQS